MVNRVILVGNLTRDTDHSLGPRGPMARLRLATNSVWRDAEGNRQEASEFHSLIAFGRLAEVATVHATRGKRVYVEGRLRTREYDGADGVRRHGTDVVVDLLRFLDRRPQGAEGETAPDPEEPLAGSVPQGDALAV